MPRRAPVLLAFVLAAGTSCELATHAFDYQIEPAASYEGICNACPASGVELRRPPCPSGAPLVEPQEERHVFAARRAHFGRASDFRGTGAATFALGIDLDCSDRPRGAPVLCAPSHQDAGALGWEALPRGIDNALLARVIAPAYAAAAEAPGRELDLDVAVSALLESGRMGIVVTVDGWNGTPEDPDVTVSIAWSPGLASGGTPAWDGADSWLRYPDVDADGTRPFRIAEQPGYVAGGMLVVDATGRGAAEYRFGTGAAHFRLLVSRLSFSGELTSAGLHRFIMSGVAGLPSARAALSEVSHALVDCVTPGESFFLQQAPLLVDGAADMPAAPGSSAHDLCDAISFAWAFDAAPASAGGTGTSDAGLDCDE